jgi:DNA-binding NarL/FixJ family response regulator
MEDPPSRARLDEQLPAESQQRHRAAKEVASGVVHRTGTQRVAKRTSHAATAGKRRGPGKPGPLYLRDLSEFHPPSGSLRTPSIGLATSAPRWLPSDGVKTAARPRRNLTLLRPETAEEPPSDGTEAISILVVEPHQICRLAIQLLIRDSHLTVRERIETADEREAIEIADKVAPHLIIYGAPVGEGHATLDEIRRAAPDAQVLFLAWDSEPSVVIDAVQAGADGIVPKSAPSEELADAIRRVALGETVIDENLAVVAAQWTARKTAESEYLNDPLSRLSDRECEILRFVGLAMSSQQIADRVGISRRTVESHLANAYRKLGVHERIDAILAYRRSRPFEDDEPQDVTPLGSRPLEGSSGLGRGNVIAGRFR